MKDALILIPSYEPDNTLVEVVLNLEKQGFPVILVNDGSGEAYEEIFMKAKAGAKYLSLPKNKGKGAALKYGFSYVKKFFPEVRFVITVDGDGQHSINDVMKVYAELEKHDELVFGVRSFDKDVPLKSKIGNVMSKINRSWLTLQYIQDDQCGLRGFPIRYLEELLKIKGNRYEYEMNAIVHFQLKQYPIYTIPIETIYLDQNAKSHFSPFKDTFKIQGMILLHSFPSFIFIASTIFLLLLFFSIGAFPLVFKTYIAYTSSFLLYSALLEIFYHSKRPWRRLAKGLLFAAIKMHFAWQVLELLAIHLKLTFFVAVPLAVLLAEGLNVFLTWVFRKIYRRF